MGLMLVAVRLLNPAPLLVVLRRPHELSGRFRQLLAVFVAALGQILCVAVVIWASYGFRYTAFNPQRDDARHLQVPWHVMLRNSPPRRNALIQFARDYHLLPEGYIYGFSYTLLFAQKRNAFLNGAFSQRGWVSFFPYCLAVKTPLPVFVLLGLAVWACWVYRYRPSSNEQRQVIAQRWPRLYAACPLLVLFSVYWAFALATNLNIGHRHLLPTYPPLFILAGAAALWFDAAPTHSGKEAKRNRGKTVAVPAVGPNILLAMRILVAASLAVAVLEAIWIWPHYLAYFNVLAGGPRNGYRHLVDSSLDWGQDLPGLKRWLADHPDDSQDPQRVYLSYFGMARPDYYGIDAQRLLSFFPRWDPHVPTPLTGGLYAISANMLNSVYMVNFPGRWNEDYEKRYQDLRPLISQYQQAIANPTLNLQLLDPASPQVQDAFKAYESLRFGRLMSYLRTREPDGQVGYSIMLYRLRDADVGQALDGPPPNELLAEPELER
jgi:hypothetical protein